MNTKRKVKVLLVTPEMAERWLNKHNVHNRPLRNHLVQKYAAAIRSGEWRLTAEPIAFSHPYTDTEGKELGEVLINGQHRLWAVMEAGQAAQFTVWWGCEPEEFEVIDQGAVRTFGDVLATTRKDLSEHTLIAGVCSSFARFALSCSNGHGICFRADHLKEMLRQVEPEIQAVVGYKKQLRKFAPRPVVSALLLAQICNPSMTALLVNQLREAVGFTERDPIRALHLYLADQLSPTSRDSLDVVHYKVCHALCARMRGEQLRILRITGEGLAYLRDGARAKIQPVVAAIHGRTPHNFYNPKLMLADDAAKCA